LDHRSDVGAATADRNRVPTAAGRCSPITGGCCDKLADAIASGIPPTTCLSVIDAQVADVAATTDVVVTRDATASLENGPAVELLRLRGAAAMLRSRDAHAKGFVADLAALRRAHAG
jgi:hypothetical protein